MPKGFWFGSGKKMFVTNLKNVIMKLSCDNLIYSAHEIAQRVREVQDRVG